MRPPTLRESQAAIALIGERSHVPTRYLTQWSDPWRAQHFVGGLREGSETFCECVIREIEEELQLTFESEFRVGKSALAHLEYVAYSESAQTDTYYIIEVFAAELGPSIRARVDRDPLNRWVCETEITRLRCGDGTPISTFYSLILRQGVTIPVVSVNLNLSFIHTPLMYISVHVE